MNKKHVWVILSMCGLAAASMGISVNSMGVFYEPVANAIGVSVGTFGSSTTVFMLSMAFTSLIAPKIYKKLDIKTILRIGVILTVASTFLMAFSSSMIHFMLLGVVRGIGVVFISMITIMSIVNNWIYKNKGVITSIIVSFSGIVGALISMAMGSIITSFGWSVGYQVAALAVLLFCLPAVLVPFTSRPEDGGDIPYGEAIYEEVVKMDKEHFSRKDSIFILFVTFAFLINFIVGFVQYFPSFATTLGMAMTTGTLMLSMAQVGNVVSKIIVGFIIDRIGVYKASLTLLLTILTASILLYTSNVAAPLLIGSLLFGATYAIGSVAIPLLTERYFGKTHYAVAYATISMVMNVGSAVSQSVYGVLHDIFNSYAYILVLVIVLVVVSITIIARIESRNNKKIMV